MKKLSLSSSNGSYIIYVNGQLANDHTALGRLVHDFSCLNSKDIYDETFKECVKRYKETEEGIQTMCSVMEDLRKEGMQQGLDQGIELMAKLYSLGCIFHLNCRAWGCGRFFRPKYHLVSS